MTQDEIIRMARETGMDIDDEASGFGAIITAEPLDLERFAALVAAHEREAFKVYVNQVVADREIAVHDAVLSEREACAKVCEELDLDWRGLESRIDCAAAIRAMGDK